MDASISEKARSPIYDCQNDTLRHLLPSLFDCSPAVSPVSYHEKRFNASSHVSRSLIPVTYSPSLLGLFFAVVVIACSRPFRLPKLHTLTFGVMAVRHRGTLMPYQQLHCCLWHLCSFLRCSWSLPVIPTCFRKRPNVGVSDDLGGRRRDDDTHRGRSLCAPGISCVTGATAVKPEPTAGAAALATVPSEVEAIRQALGKVERRTSGRSTGRVGAVGI